MSASNASARERALVVLLRLSGSITVTAFAAMLLPADWMAEIHGRLGLGTFPDSPITLYLSRSIAALYSLYGVLVLLVSRDVRRHRPIVAYIARGICVFGALMLAIDLQVGQPLWWTLGEGPVLLGEGLVLLWLLRSVPLTSDGSPGPARRAAP